MKNSDNDIHDYQARGIIKKLISFFGTSNIEKALKKYDLALNSAGPIYRDYYIKTRHPWFEFIKRFYELDKKGKSIKNHIDINLKRLAGDAKKLSILQRNMPQNVRNKFKQDLLDENRAVDFLFELHIAWHYYLKGYEIEWYEEENCPEFLVKTPKLQFNVECKRVSVDIARKIWRKDFYRFAEIFLNDIKDENVQGSIDITLTDRLEHSFEYLKDLSAQIQNIIIKNKTGQYNIPLGRIEINLTPRNGRPVDLKERYCNFWKRKPNEAQGVIFAKSKAKKPVDPIELTILSLKSDRVLKGVQKKIQSASSNQLPKTMPGIIVCFLEDISPIEMHALASDSGLQLMSNYILDKDTNQHLAAISYCSEEKIIDHKTHQRFEFQGLVFNNPNCIFQMAKDFNFISFGQS